MPTRPGFRPARRPTPDELRAAVHRRVRDVIAPDLRVLLCGINPGLYTAAVGHHFARPGNRFWPALHDAGITPRRLAPHEERLLLLCGYGLTNVVSRPSARAEEITTEELRRGARRLAAKAARLRPRVVAVLGLGAYRAAFDAPRARLGLQEEARIGPSRAWVLPNPSGLNAHFRAGDFARLFAELHAFVS